MDGIPQLAVSYASNARRQSSATPSHETCCLTLLDFACGPEGLSPNTAPKAQECEIPCNTLCLQSQRPNKRAHLALVALESGFLASGTLSPDAGCATGDQHDFAGEIGIDGDHGFLLNGARVAEGGIAAIM